MFKAIRHATLCVALLLGSGTFLHADVFNGAGFSFVDATATSAGVATGNIVIAGDGRTIGSFNSVTLTGATHTWLGDLEIILRNVTTGQTVTLTSPPDARGANFNGNYTFTVNAGLQTIDEATNGLLDADNLASGSYAISSYGGGTNPGPRTNFNSFLFLPFDGTWQLQVSDFGVQDTGALTGWSIDITAVPEPTSIALLGAGLLPVYVFVRRRVRRSTRTC